MGRVVDALERLGLSDNTVVIFHSDNGGTRHFSAPLAGGKGTLYEGGLRVPTAIWGAGIRQGVSAEPILSMDLYPTMLDLAGLPAPARHKLDGVSIQQLLTDGEPLNRESVFWHFPSYIGGGGPSSAMRKGDYKLVEHFETQRIELFDLANDPYERRNLADSNPELAQQLAAELRAWHEATGAPRPTAANPDFDPDTPRKRGREDRKPRRDGEAKPKITSL